MDLKSLYTKIPNPDYKVVITTFLALILTVNNFIFNCKNFSQIKGCATGTTCAPLMQIFLWLILEENTYTH